MFAHKREQSVSSCSVIVFENNTNHVLGDRSCMPDKYYDNI